MLLCWYMLKYSYTYLIKANAKLMILSFLTTSPRGLGRLTTYFGFYRGIRDFSSAFLSFKVFILISILASFLSETVLY